MEESLCPNSKPNKKPQTLSKVWANCLGNVQCGGSSEYYDIPPKINPETSRLGRQHSGSNTCSQCQDESQPEIPVFRMWRRILKPPSLDSKQLSYGFSREKLIQKQVEISQVDCSHKPQACELWCSVLASDAAKVRMCLNVQLKQFHRTIFFWFLPATF